MEIFVSYEQRKVLVTVFHIKRGWGDEEVVVVEAHKAYERGTQNMLLDPALNSFT